MSGNSLITFGAALAADVLSAFQIPGGNTLAAIANQYVSRRRQEAANILIGEISQGYHDRIDFEERDVEPFVEIILRFSKAVEAGAARENLRLLAQVIAGLKKNKALDDPDSFRKWCGVLEDLTRDELITIGVSYRISKEAASDPEKQKNFWQELQRALFEGGYEITEISALAASISRTGLLVPMSAYGGLIYLPSARLTELGLLANIESFQPRASKAD